MSFAVLFLCTGNYYRSRFAEILFNARTVLEPIDFRATSRGVAIELGVDNLGPISSHTLKGLKHLDIRDNSVSRFPRQVQDEDFKDADLIIAIDEAEHRAMIQGRYPNWVNRIEYWHVADLWAVAPEDACRPSKRTSGLDRPAENSGTKQPGRKKAEFIMNNLNQGTAISCSYASFDDKMPP